MTERIDHAAEAVGTMTNLHDARVEAACNAYQAAQNADPYDFKGRMSAALAAADAAVTVEWIAEVLRRHLDFTPGDSCRCGWVATVGDSSHARHQAFKLIELLRGGDGVTR